MSKKQKEKKGSNGVVTMLIGFLFILAAAGLIIYNMKESNDAYQASLEVLPQIEQHIKETKEKEIHSTVTKNKELPKLKIKGKEYVGQLDIPSIALSLPVLAEWSYENLKKAPCTYSGTPYTGDFVIAGHNYARHFSPIKSLPAGADVYFTDMDGDTFSYKVSKSEIVDPYQKDLMVEGEDWDMTMFTCTTGGRSRHAVRCQLID